MNCDNNIAGSGAEDFIRLDLLFLEITQKYKQWWGKHKYVRLSLHLFPENPPCTKALS